MEEIVADLLGNTSALGVWLLQGDRVLAGAVQDPSSVAPRVRIDSEVWLELGGTQVFAEPLRGVTLVVVFDHTSSWGLVRLRVRQAKPAIERALATVV